MRLRSSGWEGLEFFTTPPSIANLSSTLSLRACAEGGGPDQVGDGDSVRRLPQIPIWHAYFWGASGDHISVAKYVVC